MIGSLRGVVLDAAAHPSGCSGEALLEVGGVGYRVSVPAGCAARLEPGGPAFLHVHTHVRDDAIVLYGFPSLEERQCFEALIGAHGVGPTAALSMLSVHSPAALHRAVQSEDAGALMLVPGVGPKTARRLLIELRSRLVGVGADSGADLAPAGPRVAAEGHAATRAEVRTALAGLGYSSEEIRAVLGRLPEGAAVEDQLRAALRELAAVG